MGDSSFWVHYLNTEPIDSTKPLEVRLSLGCPSGCCGSILHVASRFWLLFFWLPVFRASTATSAFTQVLHEWYDALHMADKDTASIDRTILLLEGRMLRMVPRLVLLVVLTAMSSIPAAAPSPTRSTSQSASLSHSHTMLSGSTTLSSISKSISISKSASLSSRTRLLLPTASQTWSTPPSLSASSSLETPMRTSSATVTSKTRRWPETVTGEPTQSRATDTVSVSSTRSRLSSSKSGSSTRPSKLVSVSVTHNTPSLSRRTSTGSSTMSERLHVYLGQCVAHVFVGPRAVKEWLPADTLVGAVAASSGAIPYYQLSAMEFRAYGLLISVSVDNPDRNATANAALDGAPSFVDRVLRDPSNAYILSVKDAMYERMVGAADTVSQALLFNEGDSAEGHGVMDLLGKRKAAIATSVNGNNTLNIAMHGFQAYRIANSEWLVLNFFDNTTIPKGCAGSVQVVVKIATFEYLPIKRGTDAICFAVLLAGLLGAIAGTPLMLSQHAGAVALLALLHFAQEDGDPLPLSINIFQASIGDSKYRYVVGVLVAQTAVLVVLAAVHYIVAVWIVPHARSMNVRLSQAMLRHPALTVAVVLHAAPGMWFCFGRNLGHLTAAHYVLNCISFSVLAYLSWIAFRGLVSSSMSVRYLPHKNGYGQLIDHGFHDELLSTMHTGGSNLVLHEHDADGHPVLVESASSAALVAFVAQEETFLDLSKHRPHAYLILRAAMRRQSPSWLRRLLLWLDEEHGEWRSIDPQSTFLKSRGYAVYSYTKHGRLWMGLEQIDVFMVALLTLVDNYTPQLASIQFGITLAVKVSMFLAAVRLQPARRTYAGVLLLLLYFFEVIAALALLISGLHTQLIPLAQMVHAVACFLCACVLLLEVLGAILIGAVVAFLMMRRRKALLSSSQGKDALAVFTSPCVGDSAQLTEGAGLVDGELEQSEAGEAARRREAAIRVADQRYAAYWKAANGDNGQGDATHHPPTAAPDSNRRRNLANEGEDRSMPSAVPPPVVAKTTRHAMLEKHRRQGEVFDPDIAELVGIPTGKKRTTTVDPIRRVTGGANNDALPPVNLVDLLLTEQHEEMQMLAGVAS